MAGFLRDGQESSLAAVSEKIFQKEINIDSRTIFSDLS